MLLKNCFKFFTASQIFRDALPHLRDQATPPAPAPATKKATNQAAKLVRPAKPTQCVDTGTEKVANPRPPKASQTDPAERAPKLIAIRTCLMPSEARDLALAILIEQGGMSPVAADLLRRKMRRTKAQNRRAEKLASRKSQRGGKRYA